jgi:6-phospho-beta-glucosidase
MKLAILGGGGVRAIMLTRSLVRRAKRLGIDRLVFMDNDEKKLALFGALCRKAGSILDPEVHLQFTKDSVEAVRDADFVFTTIRPGGDRGRATDERIGLSHGVIGQETTGVGGFAMAMRSIPPLVDYLATIRRHAKPGVIVFNFTNPSGLVTQALRDKGYDFVYGICDAPSGFMGQVAELYGRRLRDLEIEMVGLNHLSYYLSVRIDGKEMLRDILANPRLYEDTDMRYFEPELARQLGVLLNEYLYYFYYRERVLQKMMAAPKIRSEIIVDINAAMMAELEKLDMERDFAKAIAVYAEHNYRRESTYLTNESGIPRKEGLIPRFDIYAEDDGAYAGVAMAFVEAKLTGRDGEMVLCLPNEGTVSWLRDSDIIETSCRIGGFGAAPKELHRELPDCCKDLVSTVKLYERQAARAILERDRACAIEALMVHPLVNSYSLARELLDDYDRLHPEFWRQPVAAGRP